MTYRSTVVPLLGAWAVLATATGCGGRGGDSVGKDGGTGDAVGGGSGSGGVVSSGGMGGTGTGAATGTGGVVVGTGGAGAGGGGGRISCPSDCLPGACQPIPLATGLLTPRGLAVAATAVYFTNTDADTVMKVDKQGGAPVVIVPHRFSSTEQPYGIAVTGSQVYWVSFFRGFIGRAGLGGENPVELSTTEGYGKDIVVDDTSLYWTTPGMIRKMSRDGGTPVTLFSGSSVQDLTVAGTSVYWTGSTLTGVGGTVMKMGLGGESPTALASDLADPQGLAVDATSVYWAGNRDSTVRKVPLGGGAATTLSTGPARPAFVAVDASDVYWTITGSIRGEGAVMKVGLEGGSMVTLAGGQPGPTRIVLDDCNVYWLDPRAGAVMKLPK